MTFLDTSVVGSNDKDSVIIHTGFFYGCHDAGNVAVQFFQFTVISRSVMPFLVAYVVGIVKANGYQ